jgi:hypothetical protein
MNSDAKFWVCMWGIAATTLVAIVITITTYNHNKNIVISEMVKNGASPVEALCALDDSMGNNPTCVIAATKLGVTSGK